MDLDCLNSIMAASGVMPADAMPAAQKSQPRRDRELIEANDFCKDPRHASEPKSQLSNFNSQGRRMGSVLATRNGLFEKRGMEKIHTGNEIEARHHALT